MVRESVAEQALSVPGENLSHLAAVLAAVFFLGNKLSDSFFEHFVFF
jgi:hypothetical protein